VELNKSDIKLWSWQGTWFVSEFDKLKYVSLRITKDIYDQNTAIRKYSSNSRRWENQRRTKIEVTWKLNRLNECDNYLTWRWCVGITWIIDWEILSWDPRDITIKGRSSEKSRGYVEIIWNIQYWNKWKIWKYGIRNRRSIELNGVAKIH